MEKFEGEFLKDKYWDNEKFREATEVSAHRTEEREGEKVPNTPQERIENYLERFSEITEREDSEKRERGILAIERLVEKKYVIKPENISDEYIKNMLLGNEAELLGYEREDVKDEQIKQTVISSLESKINSSLRTYTVPGELRESLENMVITDQKSRMKQWLNYLTGEEAEHAPVALRYWAFAEMLKQGDYDSVRGEYNKRTEATVAIFPELDQQALAFVFDAVERRRTGYASSFSTDDEARQAEFSELLKSENFGKLYAFMQEHVRSLKLPSERLMVTEGEWRTFPQGSSSEDLIAPLQGFQTKWCIAGEGFAGSYLKTSDVLIYFSKDVDGQNTIPRACIIDNKEQGITEVRGIIFNEEVKQHLDDYITPVVDEKLKDMEGGEKWADKMADMKMLRELHFKHLQKVPFTKDDLTFLYEIDHPIQSSGFGTDPRVKELLEDRNFKEDFYTAFPEFAHPKLDKTSLEKLYGIDNSLQIGAFRSLIKDIRSNRNVEEDMLVIFECTKAEIANVPSEINENTKAYVGELEPGIFQKLPEGIEHVYTSFPEGKLALYDIELGGKTKDELVQALMDKGIRIPAVAHDILNSTDFYISTNKESAHLVCLTVKELGFPDGATTDELYVRAHELGLELCPPETGPQLRLATTSPDYMRIAMKTISERNDSPEVFFLNSVFGLSLGTDTAESSRMCHLSDEFVFRARPPSPEHTEQASKSDIKVSFAF